ncbi:MULTISPECIES: RdgB/HAM1 family non-canonical purine NTP pyrophosphatase [unclassified Breznakia]|uniref:RdgB/HAM1 family non-canonical purine NTP pyrophosphatase n=1 Tax=unclassified Breznakia TaxID=2623764 RepID=UPI00247448E4|nr:MULTISPECIES: RdgB/HAM1 family non-canonical purine NTP pyrophosphatase [unclassified Breznakia]MDH6365899.1 XTP/dITP diphosphohydrolase [Breznakia sp. PH1-1]MDH6403169.1 XTP/dITP diphosphohydrolase [Breznakia sp. PF1-11]MDH6410878.1 XTP/dITP diphosphohydrolase [Breznakia sp. PFB1-11]MDH6413065.1 XTP/dITP diphosphohydrolase [Breznakia sp. PFB1-14]MDH6415433.1 XTP/dITP diphosphohydrolase [Breznakia sp. PFB1-4]
MKELFIATSNLNKVKEFKEMLEPLGYDVKSLRDLDQEIEIIEDGDTFEANAYKKAKSVYDVLHVDVISDDSGLCVNAMNGAPGVYSARYLGEDTSYDLKNQTIIDEVAKSDDRGAKFVCVISHVKADGSHKEYRGEVHGEIYTESKGTNGFGYDPIFYYPPFQTTLANVDSERKNTVSHRGIALTKLLEDLK